MCVTGGDKGKELKHAATWAAAAHSEVGFTLARCAWMGYNSLDRGVWDGGTGDGRWADKYTGEALPPWNWYIADNGHNSETIAKLGEGAAQCLVRPEWRWISPGDDALNVVCHFHSLAGCGDFHDKEKKLHISPNQKPALDSPSSTGSITCAPGYRQTSGDGIASCRCRWGRYRWHHSSICSQIYCKNAPVGHVPSTNKVAAGSSVPVTCDEGYKITGQAEIGCSITGAWTGNPSCELSTVRLLTSSFLSSKIGMCKH